MSLFRRRAAAPSTVSDTVSDPDPAESPAPAPEPAISARPDGPFDAGEVDGRGDRLDLGAVWLAPVPGLELRIEIDQQADAITALQLIVGDSAAQVQAFAAPRSGGLWAEIREEIAASIDTAGGTVERTEGVFGIELAVRLPQVGPDGRTVFAPARFIGIDGPRWFLRVVLSGRAAVEPDADGPVLDAVRGLVVARDGTPMAPRELLPLRLPEQGEPAEEPADAAGPRQPDLNPFERGPEITEVR